VEMMSSGAPQVLDCTVQVLHPPSSTLLGGRAHSSESCFTSSPTRQHSIYTTKRGGPTLRGDTHYWGGGDLNYEGGAHSSESCFTSSPTRQHYIYTTRKGGPTLRGGDLH